MRVFIFLFLLSVAAGVKMQTTTKKQDTTDDSRSFTDKNYPGCYRDVTIKDGKVQIKGIDGVEGHSCIGKAKTQTWQVRGKAFYDIESDENPLDPNRPWIEVDFSKKKGSFAGPSKVFAALELDLKPAQITFQETDGKFEEMNSWVEVGAEELEHEYEDPNHIKCPRKLNFKKGQVTFTGADGEDGGHCHTQKEGQAFTIHGHSHGDEVKLDFSSKGGPADLVGKVNQEGHITWPDGNTWKRSK